MFAFMMYVLNFFDPTASATAYGRRPKFAMAEQSATAEGENCAYGPTLILCNKIINSRPSYEGFLF